MNAWHGWIAGALALGAPAPERAGAAAELIVVAPQDLAAELQALEEAHEEANAAWYERYKKAPADGRSALFAERTRLFEDFARRFAELAARARGTEVGAKADVKVVGLGMNSDDEATRARVKAAADELLELYLESEALAQFAGMVGHAEQALGEEYCRAALQRLSEKSPHRTVRAPALFALAQRSLEAAGDDAAKVAEARKLFEKLAADYADVPYYGSKTFGSAATGTLYELDHLQVGMLAPDFEATDENGASFKLSDYRGKVVVVDFWGFW
jgi:hypothetical protein